MDVTPLIRRDLKVIQSYKGGKFRVSGQIYNHAVLILPDQVVPWDVPDTFSELNDTHFMPLYSHAENLDVVLLGTGARMEFFKPALRHELKGKGLNVDAMETGAACRTYNVLAAEGRRVAAALFPV